MPVAKQDITLNDIYTLMLAKFAEIARQQAEMAQEQAKIEQRLAEIKPQPAVQPRKAKPKPKAVEPKETYVERQNRILKKYHGAWAKNPWVNFMEDIRQGRDDYSDPWEEAINAKNKAVS
ncbi:MAG: hypothetical protein LBM77_12045 [Spirochaetaceae bacterium]|jgi:hypothetical protein|nr:hypothetical protein [Spirochaetaceae bacterium]